MNKYHLTSDGPKLCKASKKTCPLGGEHFSDLGAAHKAFELSHESQLAEAKTLKNSLSKTMVTASIKPQAGGRYFGCHVSQASVEPFLQAWREEVGATKAARMEMLKAQRDRGAVYHLTVVTPPEMKQLGKDFTAFPTTVQLTYSGVGKAVDGEQEAWFVVCDAPAVQKWREANGLQPKDLHVTLGFEAKDVHTKPKGAESLVLPAH